MSARNRPEAKAARRAARAEHKASLGDPPVTYGNRTLLREMRFKRGSTMWTRRRLRRGGLPMEPWSWASTAVPAPDRRNRNRAANKVARRQRRVNRIAA